MGSENEVTGHDHAYRLAGPHTDGWLYAKIALDHALAGLIERVGGPAADGALDVAIPIAPKFCANAENGRETSGNEHTVPVMVGAVRETGIALGISAGRGDDDGRPIRENDPVPGH